QMKPNHNPIRWAAVSPQLMKPRAMTLKLLVACSAFVTTALFGQSTFVWTNTAGGDVGVGANWNPNGVPSPNAGGSGDEMQWNGLTGDLSLISATGSQVGGSGGAVGLNVHLTSANTHSVNIHTTLATSSGLRLKQITIDPGAGQFSLGDTTGN